MNSETTGLISNRLTREPWDVVTIVRPFDVCAVLRAKLPLKNAVGFTDFLERLGDAVNDQIGIECRDTSRFPATGTTFLPAL